MKAEKPRHKAGDLLNTNTGAWARQDKEREPKKWEETGSATGPLIFPAHSPLPMSGHSG